ATGKLVSSILAHNLCVRAQSHDQKVEALETDARAHRQKQQATLKISWQRPSTRGQGVEKIEDVEGVVRDATSPVALNPEARRWRWEGETVCHNARRRRAQPCQGAVVEPLHADLGHVARYQRWIREERVIQPIELSQPVQL